MERTLLLTDLPGEILQNIAKFLPQEKNVYKGKAGSGWMVCKKLNAAIKYNLCGDQHLTTYRSKSGRKFLSQNLGDYLKAHTKRARRGRKLKMRQGRKVVDTANYFLMDYILMLLKKVYAVSSPGGPGGPGGVDDGQQDRDEAMLCDAMVFFFNFNRVEHFQTQADLERLVLYKHDVETNRRVVAEAEDTISIATVAAAVVICDEIPLSLTSDPYVMWRRSPLFGTPFCAAVFAGKSHIVLHALRNLKSVGYPTDIYILYSLLNGAGIALNKRDPHTAEIILSFIKSENFRIAFYEKKFSWWLDCWVSLGYPGPALIILAILNAQPNSPPCIGAFIKACEQGSVTVVHHLISMGKVNVNAAISHFGQHPLGIAIRVAPRNVRIHLVEHLLALGANPNGYASTMNNLTGRPLVAAVQPYDYHGSYPSHVSDIQGGIKIIVALLNAGADPQLVSLHGRPDTGRYASSLFHSMFLQLKHKVALHCPDIWGQIYRRQIGDQPLRFWSQLLAKAEMAHPI